MSRNDIVWSSAFWNGDWMREVSEKRNERVCVTRHARPGGNADESLEGRTPVLTRCRHDAPSRNTSFRSSSTVVLHLQVSANLSCTGPQVCMQAGHLRCRGHTHGDTGLTASQRRLCRPLPTGITDAQAEEIRGVCVFPK